MRQRPDRPVARQSGLVVRVVADEVLVYDLERHRAHRLNAVAATVWRLCDGAKAAPAIAAGARERGVPVTADAVRYALAELGRARLLAGPETPGGPTRRQLLQRLGTAAALPLVASVAAPTAAHAQSCLGVGQTCSEGGDCCSTCCDVNVCAECASDRALKTDFGPVDPGEILAGVVALPIETWSYRGETVRHLGPMAQDFAAFGLGADDRHIAVVDASGVALAAIQGLHALLAAQAARLAALEGECAALRAELGRVRTEPVAAEAPA
jgi:hypothetical protein